MPDPWPLRQLVLRTPRLTLRPDDDERLDELAALALRGVHPGMAHQRQGFGTEMRAAVLLFAFDQLGAATARSGTFADNPASLRVSERLGYCRDGSSTHVRRGRRATEIRVKIDAASLVRPEWTLQVEGVQGCRELLGAA